LNAWNAEQYEGGHSYVWQFGGRLVELLAPRAGQRILDLGCGTGQLTAEIAAAGAEVVGLDSSPEMLGQARQNYPHLKFVLADATSFRLDQDFDAVFSNAALHWVKNAEAAVRSIASALRPGGRFVAEFGGAGNIVQILAAAAPPLPRRDGAARADVLLLAQAAATVVQQVDVLRPQPRRMRTQVHEDRRPVRADHFEREGCRGSGSFPTPGRSPRQFVRFHAGAHAGHQPRRLQLLAACAMASNGFTAGTTSSSTGLPSFSAISTTWLNSSFS
jgi:SAM-dependent methyltransferase